MNDARTDPTRRQRRHRSATVWIVLGLIVLISPIVLTQINDHQLFRLAQHYERQVDAIEPDERVQAYLDEAHAYNAQLARQGHHARPPTPGAEGMDAYLGTLDAPETGGVMAHLRIPAIDVDLPVFHTTSDRVLYRGAGHMFGTDLPVGGPSTTSVISAHTGMVDATMFDDLPKLRVGDEIVVQVMGQTLVYRMRSSVVVGPDEYDAITYEDGVDKLVLITCTPYGINSDRLLVEATRVPDAGAPEDATWHPRLSWWMILDLAFIAAVIVWELWGRRRREREQAP